MIQKVFTLRYVYSISNFEILDFMQIHVTDSSVGAVFALRGKSEVMPSFFSAKYLLSGFEK